MTVKAQHLLNQLEMVVPGTSLLWHELNILNETLIGHFVLVCWLWAFLLLVQAYGLWKGRQWAVWLAFATSVLILGSFAWLAVPIFGAKTAVFAVCNLLVASYLLILLRGRLVIA